MVAVLTWTEEVESFNLGVWVEIDRPGRVARDRDLPYKLGTTTYPYRCHTVQLETIYLL